MNLVFVDLAKNIKNAAALYNKIIPKKVIKNIKPKIKKILFFISNEKLI